MRCHLHFLRLARLPRIRRWYSISKETVFQVVHSSQDYRAVRTVERCSVVSGASSLITLMLGDCTGW